MINSEMQTLITIDSLRKKIPEFLESCNIGRMLVDKEPFYFLKKLINEHWETDFYVYTDYFDYADLSVDNPYYVKITVLSDGELMLIMDPFKLNIRMIIDNDYFGIDWQRLRDPMRYATRFKTLDEFIDCFIKLEKCF